ncbi:MULTISPECIES: hypothetical protein [unclassified Sphingosinithalassobacter]|uniref:hypothetical protein n=1 Tax=unclassified Sphingosinithalassobacter TaxID=2676235 RepID=UPI00165E1992|nr:hypothetical protein [Sphingosinithalassobacter sp. CS137]
MIDLGSQWALLTILGPIVLAAAIIWAILHNRSSRRQRERTEDATHRMYDEQNREDQLREERS